MPFLRHNLPTLRAIALAAGLWLLFPVPIAHAQSDIIVKAAFIEKLCRFIEWPKGHREGPFVIALVGDSDLAMPLQQLAKIRTMRGRQIRIDQPKNQLAWLQADLIVIAPTEGHRVDDILASIADKPILTISEGPQFSRTGVTINLLERENTLAFEINIGEAEKHGLYISSRLLKLATIVTTAK